MAESLFKTVVAGKKIVHSQVVHLQGQDIFEIIIGSWSCFIRFATDDKHARYNGVFEGEKLFIDIYNHVNPLGEYLLSPFTIAQHEGKTIWMTYTTILIDAASSLRRFEYTLWMENDHV